MAVHIRKPIGEGRMSEISTLESLADFWERVDYVGLFLVFVGAAVESLVEFTSLIRSSFWKPKIGKASALVLVVGLALELISSSSLSGVNRQVVGILYKQASDAQTAAREALQKADDAESRLDDATERVAKAHERAAHAEKTTEDERAARMKLEAQMSSKRLSGKHQ